MNTLLSELKRRRVPRVVLVYTAGAAAVVQAADVIVPQLGFPAWTMTALVWCGVIGLPVAAVLAWLFDVTPGGIRRAPDESAPDAASPAWISARASVVVVLLLVVTAATGWWAGRTVRGIRVAPENADAYVPAILPGVAVLPPANLSPDTAATFAFAQGLQDDLITQLANVRGLRAIGRTSVLIAAGRTGSTPRRVGAQLGVDYVVELTVRMEGERLRVGARLVDVTTDQALWGESYDRGIADLFAIQSDIAQQIAANMGAELTQRERARIEARPTEDLAAYRLLLEGRLFFNRFTEPDITTALERFRAAMRLDPRMAAAYADVGMAYTMLGIGHGSMPPGEAFPLARRAADSALVLRADLPSAHTVLAMYHHLYTRDWAASEAAFRTAIRLDPGQPHAWEMYSQLLNTLQRSDEAIRMIETALALEPVSPIIRGDAAVAYWVAGRYDEALSHARSGLEIAPDFAPDHWIAGEIFLELGQRDSALYHEERAVSIAPPFLINLVVAYARVGEIDRVRELLPELRAAERHKPTGLSAVFAWLGEPDSAFAYLEREVEAHSMFTTWGLAFWYGYDPIRDDPRFEAVLRRLDLPSGPAQPHFRYDPPALRPHDGRSRTSAISPG